MKYKFYGFALLTFLGFWLYLIFSREGLHKSILLSHQIEKVRTEGLPKELVLTAETDIEVVCNTLRNAIRVRSTDIRGIKKNKVQYTLLFHVKRDSTPERIELIFNEYDGLLFRSRDFYYRGRMLDSVIHLFSPQENNF